MSGLDAAVLAGGRSTRMGRDKAFVDFGGELLVVRVVRLLTEVSDDVLVVAKRTAPFEELGLRAVPDDRPEDTPLAGIAGALRAASSPSVFVCACDLPFVSPRFVRELAARAGDHDAVVPVRDGRAEPLHAVWSKGALHAVTEALATGERAPKRVVDRLDVLLVEEAEWRPWDPEGRSLQGVNTPEELDAALGVEEASEEKRS